MSEKRTPTGKTRKFRSSAGTQHVLSRVEVSGSYGDHQEWDFSIDGLSFRAEPIDDPSLKWILSGADKATSDAINAAIKGQIVYPTMRANMTLLLDLAERTAREHDAADAS